MKQRKKKICKHTEKRVDKWKMMVYIKAMLDEHGRLQPV